MTISIADCASLTVLVMFLPQERSVAKESLPVQECLLRNDGRGQEAVAVWLFVRFFLASCAGFAVRVTIYRYERDNVPECPPFIYILLHRLQSRHEQDVPAISLLGRRPAVGLGCACRSE